MVNFNISQGDDLHQTKINANDPVDMAMENIDSFLDEVLSESELVSVR